MQVLSQEYPVLGSQAEIERINIISKFLYLQETSRLQESWRLRFIMS